MGKLYSSKLALGLLTSVLISSVACNSQPDSTAQFPISATTPSTDAVQPTQAKPASAPAAATKPDPYQQALDRASSAYTISRSAQSRDDWRLVMNRWQQAIDLMKTVPASNARHRLARQKLAEYRQNLAYAQQQANRSTQLANPDGVIVLPPRSLPQPQLPPPPVPVAASPTVSARPATAAAPGQQTFTAPIVRREGNTPVIQVVFNNSQPFDMIVDTGASGTLITQQMAAALNVVPVAQAKVDTASQKGVTFPLGYVQSIQVGGAASTNVLVAIAGSGLETGLLGHDFFGHYDVTIREQEVEFRERS
jgi:predicted aspartyl protease